MAPELDDQQLRQWRTVAIMQEYLAEDRRLTIDDFSLEVDISEESAWDILHNKLNKRKKCAHWVPHLTEEQVSHTFLSRTHFTQLVKACKSYFQKAATGSILFHNGAGRYRAGSGVLLLEHWYWE